MTLVLLLVMRAYTSRGKQALAPTKARLGVQMWIKLKLPRCIISHTLEKCFLPESDSSVGGGFWIVISSTFIGGKRAKGACPCASSRIVIPNDHMSASELYLQATG